MKVNTEGNKKGKMQKDGFITLTENKEIPVERSSLNPLVGSSLTTGKRLAHKNAGVVTLGSIYYSCVMPENQILFHWMDK